jgi:para-aminobenzoate synthetase component 1
MTSRRIFTIFQVDNIVIFKRQLLNWGSQFSSCCFLDNHAYNMPGGQFELMAGVGAEASLRPPGDGALNALRSFHEVHQDWLFGHLGYDLKNEVEGLHSDLPDFAGFPDLHFFVPRYVFLVRDGLLHIGTLNQDSAAEVLQAVQTAPDTVLSPGSAASWSSRFSRQEYLDTVVQLKEHIHRGDCYEITFCQEFYAEGVNLDPLALYRELTRISPMPHSAYYASSDLYLLCASPERYLQLKDGRLLSQPIKGTAKRKPGDQEADHALKEELRNSPKEQSENVMIVDLVRNDLSKVCEEGSVQVSELGGIYAFPQVYQMISSIEGILPSEVHWTQALKATFPMGSMTGAPKRRAMELIERYERTRRGLYSGAVGYIDPTGNFDFAVVIRSLLYNRAHQYLSYSVGSAITAASDPLSEYEECLLKASAIRQALLSA